MVHEFRGTNFWDTLYDNIISVHVERQTAKNITDYRKIPKISPSMYKPPSKYKAPKPVTQKTLR